MADCRCVRCLSALVKMIRKQNCCSVVWLQLLLFLQALALVVSLDLNQLFGLTSSGVDGSAQMDEVMNGFLIN